MIKMSSSLYKMPYYNIESQSLKSVDRQKDDYQEIVCVCGHDCGSPYEGFKYSFKYTANPTIEPISYRLKGWTQDASLNFNDIGVNIEPNVMGEVQTKINTLGSAGLEPNILSRVQNRFNNWQLSDKIFQKVNSIIYKHEVYDEYNYYDTFIPQITISSEIYIVNISWSVVH